MKNDMEIWKDIEGYEGLYQVSNMGRIKSLHSKHTKKEKILKPHKATNGYLTIILSNHTYKFKYIHRLVAETFIPNTYNKEQVDHINTNKTDNRVENLRWVTRSENMKNPITYTYRCNNHHKSKPTLQLTLNGVVIKQWQSMSEASRTLKINQGNIDMCCSGKRKTAGGYRWQYLDDWLADWWEQEMDKVA